MPTPFYITSYVSNLVLDVPLHTDGGLLPGTVIQQWSNDKEKGAASGHNQQWHLIRLGTFMEYQIVNKNSGLSIGLTDLSKVMDHQPVAQQSPQVFGPETTNIDAQLWRLWYPISTAFGGVMIQNKASKLVLDVPAGGPGSGDDMKKGAKIQQHSMNGNANQQWLLSPTPGNNMPFVSASGVKDALSSQITISGSGFTDFRGQRVYIRLYTPLTYLIAPQPESGFGWVKVEMDGSLARTWTQPYTNSGPFTQSDANNQWVSICIEDQNFGLLAVTGLQINYWVATTGP
jgi:Ricin-type beta-trefoil lectin domain-like